MADPYQRLLDFTLLQSSNLAGLLHLGLVESYQTDTISPAQSFARWLLILHGKSMAVGSSERMESKAYIHEDYDAFLERMEAHNTDRRLRRPIVNKAAAASCWARAAELTRGSFTSGIPLLKAMTQTRIRF